MYTKTQKSRGSFACVLVAGENLKRRNLEAVF